MKIGITLSGGGARGIAHLGVLKALQEIGIFPERIVGVSAGAIVGAFYAAGYQPDEVLGYLQKTNLLWFLKPTFFRQAGLIDTVKLQELYKPYFPENTFEALKKPLTIAATDITAGQTVYFSSGELIKPVLASSCIPVLFAPVKYQNIDFVDGGILNNMPTEPLKPHCDYIIGVHTNPYDSSQPLTSARSVLERCLLLSVYQSAKRNFAGCDMLIEPDDLKRFNPLQLTKAKEIFQIGYQYTLKKAKEIEEKIRTFKEQNDFL